MDLRAFKRLILATKDEYRSAVEAAEEARAKGIQVHVAAFDGPHTYAGHSILNGAIDAEATIVTYSGETAQCYRDFLADPNKAEFAAAVAGLSANPAYEAVALDGELLFIPRRISDALH
jgi:hypothetical protein